MERDIGAETKLAVRIAPGTADTLGPLGRAAGWVGGRATHGDPPRVLTTLALHRKLFRRWLPFAAGLLRGTDLPRADVELVILRTACNCASWYEWVQHVPLAADAGLDSGTATRVVVGPAADGWTSRQRALLLGTDELHECRLITDETWELLAGVLDEQELLELCFVVGHYEMLAMALNSLGVEAESTALARLDEDAHRSAAALHQTLRDLRRSHRRGFDHSGLS